MNKAILLQYEFIKAGSAVASEEGDANV